jgi:hypothetical protein
MKIQETQSVQLPLLGTVDNLEIRVNSFPLFPSSIEVFWKVSGPIVSKEGVITLPQEIVSVWGTDDTVVKDYILEQLGLVEDTTPQVTIPPTPSSEETPIDETPIDETPIDETPIDETPIDETPQ